MVSVEYIFQIGNFHNFEWILMSTSLFQSSAVLLPASVEVVHEVAVHKLIRVNPPQEV